jgi:heat shock protein HtpX
MSLFQRITRPIVDAASLFGRALVALTLTLGYLVLGLGLAGGCYYLSSLLYNFHGGLYRWACTFLDMVGAVIFAFWLPLWRRAEPPGYRIEPQEQPKLFETINKVALLTRQRMPAEIYLTAGLTAGIGSTGGVLGFRKRVMAIGLPLLQLCTVSQLEAAVAHEFGHLDKGNLYIGAWLGRLRAAIETSIDNMSGRSYNLNPIRARAGIFQLPFVLYGRLFMRAALPLLRSHELAADRLAARVIGQEHIGEALQALYRHTEAYRNYLFDDVLPAVELGFQPPFLEGMSCLRLAETKTGEMEHEPDDPHPPLATRLARLASIRDLPATRASNHSPALSLLDNVAELETQILSRYADEDDKPLKPISWSETGDRVIIPYWRWKCSLSRGALEGLTLGSLPTTLSNLNAFAEQTFFAWRTPSELQDEAAKEILAFALGSSLHRSGWKIDHGPGYLRMCHGDLQINPREWIDQLSLPEFTQDRWQEKLALFRLDPATSLESAPAQ